MSLAAFFTVDAMGMSRRCYSRNTRPNGRPLLGERVGVRAVRLLTLPWGQLNKFQPSGQASMASTQVV